MKQFLLSLGAVLLIGITTGHAMADAAAWEQLPMPGGKPAMVRDLVIGATGDVYITVQQNADAVWRSADHGQTWKSIHYNLPENIPYGGKLCFNTKGDLLFLPIDHAHQGIYRLPAGGMNWIAGKYDPVPLGGSGCPAFITLNKAGDVIVVAGASGGARILRSTDGGSAFSYTPAILGGAAIFDMKRSPTNADEIVIGTETGPNWRSTDGGVTFASIGVPQSAGNCRLAYNRLGQLFSSATHDSNRAGWLFARWTSGTEWVKSDAGLPDYQDTRAAALSGAGVMYVGNSNVYLSKDDGATWSLAGAKFPATTFGTAVQMRVLRVDDAGGYLYAGAANSGKITKEFAGVWRLTISEKRKEQ